MNLFSSTFEERRGKEKKNKSVGDAEQRPSFVQEFKEAGFVNTKKSQQHRSLWLCIWSCWYMWNACTSPYSGICAVVASPPQN
jgi:hypothetical protein